MSRLPIKLIRSMRRAAAEAVLDVLLPSDPYTAWWDWEDEDGSAWNGESVPKAALRVFAQLGQLWPEARVLLDEANAITAKRNAEAKGRKQ